MLTRAKTTAGAPRSQYTKTTAINVRGWSLCLIWRPSDGLKKLSVTLEIVDANASTRNTAPKTSPMTAIAELLCITYPCPAQLLFYDCRLEIGRETRCKG